MLLNMAAAGHEYPGKVTIFAVKHTVLFCCFSLVLLISYLQM